MEEQVQAPPHDSPNLLRALCLCICPRSTPVSCHLEEHRYVEANQVPVLKWSVVGDSVTSYLVHAGAHRLLASTNAHKNTDR